MLLAGPGALSGRLDLSQTLNPFGSLVGPSALPGRLDLTETLILSVLLQDLGPFLGATGGFAAGEKGVRMLVETGEVKLRGPKDPPRRQVRSVDVIAMLSLIL